MQLVGFFVTPSSSNRHHLPHSTLLISCTVWLKALTIPAPWRSHQRVIPDLSFSKAVKPVLLVVWIWPIIVSTYIDVPGKNMRPYGLVIDCQSKPWIVFISDKTIGTMDPKSIVLNIFDTPKQNSIIRRIVVTLDERIWWTDARKGYIGIFDPQQKSMHQWPTPGGETAGSYAMTVDNQDCIWYLGTSLQPNRLIGFNSHSEQFISTVEVQSGK